MIVRPARSSEDVLAVARFFREYADWLGIDLSFQNFEAELAGLPGKYAAPAGELFLAEGASGSLLGCVGVAPFSRSGACELKRLYVRPETRRTGAGRSLVEAAIAFAAQAGYREMLLDTLPSMTGALAIYRVLGFESIPPYYANPVPGALFLSKNLQPRSGEKLGTILRELIAREPIFHRPELGTTRAEFDAMMADNFWEIGASGKVYERAYVLNLLEERHREPQEENLQPFGFRIRELCENVYLLHYDLFQGERRTRRTTVWQRVDGDWKIVFHQGTVVQE